MSSYHRLTNIDNNNNSYNNCFDSEEEDKLIIESLKRSDDMIETSKNILHDTINIAGETLIEIDNQQKKLKLIGNNVVRVDDNLSKSGGFLSKILQKNKTQKILSIIIILFIIAIIVGIVIYKTKK